MPGKHKFDEQLAGLAALRERPPEAHVEPLRKALAHRNNLMVAKAADLVREFGLTDLTPDLVSAFDRFFENPAKSDPQCWAKNALSRALATFELQDADLFLRGMRHIQMEGVWGGKADSAGTLRATCAQALVQCRRVADTELLSHLLELFADTETSVRAEAANAIEQIGSPAASLVLRLRAVLGNDEPAVLGACYAGVLRIEGVSAIPWVSRRLAPADDTAAEAALAIAGTHTPEGFDALRDALGDASDPWFRSVLLSAIALTRQDAALEFLFSLIVGESQTGEAAIAAILRALPSPDVVRRLEALVEGNPRLAGAFAAHQPSRSTRASSR
ncbi:MAG TPA: hypothetical protein VMH39_11885 [Gemmatimonadaceae bacterium]|nr:hypothetical protein [Gemmatimonadaceae bacterium]